MARWRSPELEALIGGPLDASGLTEAALNRLKSDHVAEGDQLDYKRVLAGDTLNRPGIRGGSAEPGAVQRINAKRAMARRQVTIRVSSTAAIVQVAEV
jgi:hypothetical protein